MEKELLRFIKENNLSPFNKERKAITNSLDIFKTKDAKSVFNKTLTKLSENFCFSCTSNLWDCFKFAESEIKKRQEFFNSINFSENSFLKNLAFPKKWWKPKYGIIVVTEDENSFIELKKLDFQVQFINSENDVASLEDYDIIQVVDCENFSNLLEQLPQTIFLDSTEEAYLERYLETLSGWENNLKILAENKTTEEIEALVLELSQFLSLLKDKEEEKLSREKVEKELETMNSLIENEIGKLSISGTSLFSILSQGKLPAEFQKITERAVKSSNLPENIFNLAIPLTIDENEFEKAIKIQNAEEHTSIAEKIRKKADELKKIPEKLEKLSNLLVYYDFISGISKYLKENPDLPEISEQMLIENSKNLFIENAQPISFHLNPENKCSILTGANSGGKTTLLEHIIQLITVFNLGLRTKGTLKMPIFSEIYYFAKNKGSTNKGAFETLLSQMNNITPGKSTIILADEIESVTEPGVAGKIISATAEYFISKGCFLVIATHLGQEIQKNLPKLARVDGIEAKGLDEFYELIVDHNPVLGRLASSTPELIVEKMASSKKTDYFNYLQKKIKNS